jgi:hypothetical protein
MFSARPCRRYLNIGTFSLAAFRRQAKDCKLIDECSPHINALQCAFTAAAAEYKIGVDLMIEKFSSLGMGTL